MTWRRLMVAVSVFLAVLSAASSSLAQNNRSAVSITGLDTAACTVPDPCRTFGVAMSKTNPGAEVVALTTGGYGPFTISNAVSIIAPPSVHAAIAPTSGDGIVISAAASDRILIRGLHLQSQGSNVGIRVNSAGSVNIHQTTIISFSAGIYAHVVAPSQLTVEDATLLRNSAYGIYADCFGAAADRIFVTVNRLTTLYSGRGVYAGFNSRFSVNEMVSNSNDSGLDCNYCEASIIRSVFSHNTTSGVTASFSTAKVYIGYSMVTLNNNGLEQVGTGQINSLGNNLVADNTTDVVGTLTPLGPK
jgi:hypothetical protein